MLAGVGREHAKWSPVATAFYRMMPTITLSAEGVWGETAERLVSAFPKGVLALERAQGPNGEKVRATVADARLERGTREHERDEMLQKREKKLREEKKPPLVQIGCDQHHFLFSIESTGAVPPEKLFLNAVNVLSEKCDRFLRELEALTTGSGAQASADIPMTSIEAAK